MAPKYDEIEPILDARTDLVRFGDVPFLELRRRLFWALPTSSHARRLALTALEMLGDRGRLDPYTDGRTLTVLRADATGWWLRDAPITFTEGTVQAAFMVQSDLPRRPRPAEGERDPAFSLPPRPDIAPDGGEAALTLRTDGATIELRYGADGLLYHDPMFDFGDRFAHHRWGATCPPTVDPAARPPQVPPPAWFLDLPDSPLSIQDLAERILGHLPTSEPVRVRMPVDAPGGVMGCWACARTALRYLAWYDSLPTEGGICIVDAYEHPPEHTCLGFGSDFKAAWAAWRAEERRVRPRPAPPLPVPPPDTPRKAPFPELDTNVVDMKPGEPVPLGSGPMLIKLSPVVDIPWPIPGPHTTPAVAIRLPPLRRDVPPAWREQGFTRWRYQIGDSSRISFGLVRDEVDGTTEVGEHLIDALDPAGLAEILESSSIELRGALREFRRDVDYPIETRSYIAWSNVHRRASTPKCQSVSHTPVIPWASQDGDYRSVQIVRVWTD